MGNQIVAASASNAIPALPASCQRRKPTTVATCTILRFPSSDRTRPISAETWAVWEKHCPPGRDLHEFRAHILPTLRAAFPDKQAVFDNM